MGKQTEIKSSKKNYGFKGSRTIGKKKHNVQYSESNDNTTEDLLKLLNTDDNHTSKQMNGYPSMPNQMPNYPSMPNQMPNYPSMPNQMPNYPSMPNQMNGYPSMPDIDPTMVHTLAPINNIQGQSMESNQLITPSQMANTMGSLANLSKLTNLSDPTMKHYSASNTGYLNQASNAGYLNQASNTGYLNQASNTGYLNQASNTGYLNQASNAGYLNQASNAGYLNQASNAGYLNQVQQAPININTFKNLAALQDIPAL